MGDYGVWFGWLGLAELVKLVFGNNCTVWERGSLLSDRVSCPIYQGDAAKSKGILLPQRSVLVVKDLFLSSRTIPPRFDSDGDAPRWNVMESNDCNDTRIVLNCLLMGSLYSLWDHCTLTRGRYGLVLATCTV